MAQIGSFALLLALALSVYSFGVGLLALIFKDDPDWNRLGETARRAGVVVFPAVLLAAVVLVVSAFRNDFSIAYIYHHSNRDLDAKYKVTRIPFLLEGVATKRELMQRDGLHPTGPGNAIVAQTVLHYIRPLLK